MRYFLIFLLVLGSGLLMGCETAADDINDERPPLMGMVEEPLLVDGSSNGYPAAPVQVAGADIYLAHDGNYAFLHMQAEVEGWVAVGFNTTANAMDGANMILGFLDNDNPAFRDDVGRGNNHAEAGVSAVEEFYLAHEGSTVVMEFSYPLSFPGGEGYNIEELTPGETYTLIVSSHNNSNNISQRHTSVGRVDFTVEPPDSANNGIY